jgi:hypothetical protein
MPSTPKVALPDALKGLTTHIQKQISITLANDENSTKDELVEFWTKKCNIPLEVANAAVLFRSQYLMHPFFNLFDSE